jgi:hypothetical protein
MDYILRCIIMKVLMITQMAGLSKPDLLGCKTFGLLLATRQPACLQLIQSTLWPAIWDMLVLGVWTSLLLRKPFFGSRTGLAYRDKSPTQLGRL